ncbi:MAG TPA: SGNH/GDSL hydrolase family protein [Solirubrobacteraceae bacterium]|nr:SGNH/GDSL hydrolase family protein [Solirubrobacteraceae bacterium]
MLDRGMAIRQRLPRRAITTLAAAGMLALILPAFAQAANGPYVSMGDSYTAAPLVPLPTGNPIGCGRSTNNYPSDVARALAPSSFTDVSCSSATTFNMYLPQAVPFGGVNPPQLNAVSPADTLVTVGIGGNDAGLITVVETCAEIDAFHPTGSACKAHYEASGSDPNVAAIKATGPRLVAVLRSIHMRAPVARALIVGYPDGLPVNGSNCWPLVPLSSGDIAYINSLEQQLNLVISRAAAGNNATFVDTFNSSIGHDACQPPGVAWVNGIVPTSAAFPLHPNQAGEQNMANQVLAALSAASRS